MMRFNAKPACTPIGLDLGAHSFKAVQLQPAVGGRREAVTLSLPRTKPGVAIAAEEILRLQGALDRRGFIGRDVVLAVPSDALSTSILELPARAPGLPLQQLAEAEFARVSKLDPSALSLSCWDLPASARTNRATYQMAVGAPTARLDALVDLTEAGRLRVMAIDDPFSAIARGALQAIDQTAAMHAVVDLGWDAARLTLVHGATVAYTRRFADAALSKLLQAAVDATGGDVGDIERDCWQHGFTPAAHADAGTPELLRGHFNPLLKEIGQTLGYGEHQYPDVPLKSLLLCGGGAALPGIAEYVGQFLQTPATLAGRKDGCAAETLALGLCLWEDAS